MITTTTYSQRDPRWARNYIGKTRQTIGMFGCTITSISNLLSYFGYSETPATVNTKLTQANGYLNALVYWSAVTRVWPKCKYVNRVYNYNNVEVAWNVYAKGVPVLVEVNGYKIGGVRHWVLFVGDRKCVDPWDGVIKPTNTYPLTGYTLYRK